MNGAQELTQLVVAAPVHTSDKSEAGTGATEKV
jgi:hypothetical protein